MQNKIDTVIFDVGWVLVELDFTALLSCLAHNQQNYSMKEVIAAINLEAHERGEFNGAELIDRLHGLTPGADRMQVKRGWLDMFSPVQPMFDLARALSPRYQVHLLSNVGDLHWAHLNNTYDLRALAHDVLPSFQAGVMKPDDEIYRSSRRTFGWCRRAPCSLMICRPMWTQRRRGWHAIQHCRRHRPCRHYAILKWSVGMSDCAHRNSGDVIHVFMTLPGMHRKICAKPWYVRPRSAGALRCSNTCCRCRQIELAIRR
jgi:hypothetical protein